MRNMLLIHGVIGFMFIVKAEKHLRSCRGLKLFLADVIAADRLGVT